MQIDQARVAICERSWVDNLDLALHVLRSGGVPLLLTTLAGVLPMVGLNYLFVDWLYSGGLYEDTGLGFFLTNALLVMTEAPLATAPLTLFLGQALFVERPNSRKIFRDFLECLPQMFLLQGVLRLLLIVPFVTWIIPYIIWPYLSEVILLERNPLVGRQGQISTRMRNSNLHRMNSSEFLKRGFLTLFLAPMLVAAVWVTQSMLLEALFGYEPGWPGQVLAMQGSLWVVTVFFTAARFLSYLDQRIRSEGWEVELFLRAQRQKLMRSVA